MAFKNTVEKVGDAALTRSIIDKSITELHCNLTTSIRQQAFRSCSALTNVNFPSVTSVALGAFWQCLALAKAEFVSAVAFANNAFYGCSALTALILRNTEQISTISGTPFASSAIASGTGYIYVPAALVDTYKAASGWSTYAAQIRAIEDYLGITDRYTWAGVAANIADGTYASVYQIGDTIPLDLGSKGKINMQIAGFDKDTLADGSRTAPISWISKELLVTTHIMNPSLVTNDDGTYQEGTGTIGGWEKCEMRTFMNSTIKPLIPSDVTSMIQTVTKTQTSYNTAGASEIQTTEDDIWIPGKNEVHDSTAIYYDLFQNELSNIKKCIVGNKKGKEWWLRDAYSSDEFNYLTTIGVCVTGSSNSRYGIAIGFCT